MLSCPHIGHESMTCEKKEVSSFGNICKLPSGKFQARYVGPDGLRCKTPETFFLVCDAHKWLEDEEYLIRKGYWTPLVAWQAADTGRCLPGRFLISALSPTPKTLPADFDSWNVDDGAFVIDTFDPARDAERLHIDRSYFGDGDIFRLDDLARKANARLKAAWDESQGEYARLRGERIFSQMPKVCLRVATLLTILLGLDNGSRVVGSAIDGGFLPSCLD
ncbi:Uncharacterised protein [Corynebacterium ulcerans]|nr:Uncharacterised protein [Corynebacterium ulcerans]